MCFSWAFTVTPAAFMLWSGDGWGLLIKFLFFSECSVSCRAHREKLGDAFTWLSIADRLVWHFLTRSLMKGLPARWPLVFLSILTPQQMVFNQRVINEGIQPSAVSAVPIIWTKLTVISPSYTMNTLLLFQQEESQVEEMKQEEHFSK